jgi:chaperonin cofactor prefoldin
MHRLPMMPFDQQVPEPDELEEGALSSDPSTLPARMKLGMAWSGVTLTGIVVLVYSTIAQLSQPSTMGGLVVLLVAYAVYGSSLKKKDTIQFADSLYYMGFLWALFALIATFLIWPAQKVSADAVLATFGYALLATFSGMLLRLLVIQFQDTLPDRLVYAQETIDRRVAALTQEINDATTEMTSFRQRAKSELGGTLHSLLRSLDDVREKMSEQHRTMTTAMSAGFESSLKEVLGRLAAIQIPQEMLTTEVATLIAALGKRGEDVEQAVQHLKHSMTQAADTVTRFGDSLYESEAAKRIGSAVNGLSHAIRGRTEEVANMTTALEDSRTELESQLKSMQSLRSSFGAISTQLSTLEAELREVSSHSLSTDVRDGLLNVQKTIQSSLDASKAIETAMRGVMSFLKDGVTQEQSINGK